jgi:diacylglycerol kinase (ATP)
MPRVALIYNPSSGRARHQRLATVEAAGALLRKAGREVRLIPTTAPGSAGPQAAEAIRAGYDTVFAAGGDGTVHDVLQGVMEDECTRSAVLGVLPLGTGNVLAYDLELPRDPLAALRRQLTFAPQRIAVGRVEFAAGPDRQARYFLITCGVGWDAVMLYRADAERKGRWGMAAYLLEGLRLAFQRDLPFFPVEWREADGSWHTARVTQAFAVRVTDLGGFMGRFAPGAALTRDDFHVVLFHSASMLRMMWYMFGAMTRRGWKVPGVSLVGTDSLACHPPEQPHPKAAMLSVEADGEYLGKMPARLSIVREAVRLLMPPGGRPGR